MVRQDKAQMKLKKYQVVCAIHEIGGGRPHAWFAWDISLCDAIFQPALFVEAREYQRLNVSQMVKVNLYPPP